MLKKNDKVALVVCSNGKNINDKERLEKLEIVLKDMDLVPIFSTFLYKDKYGRSASAKERASEVMRFYKDNSVKAIFDISGGDIANEVLDYLDYEVIEKNNKPFFGYSDVTTVLNAITTKTKSKTYLYQILNIIDHSKRKEEFYHFVLKNDNSFSAATWNFVQGSKIEGVVVGGNIRCLLKLAGTEYFPNVEDKVLFLEGMSTSIEGLITHLTQLKQMGVFNKISGLLLGTFTKIEIEHNVDDIFEIVKDFVPKDLSIAKTQEIGHGKDSKLIVIGEKIVIEKGLK